MAIGKVRLPRMIDRKVPWLHFDLGVLRGNSIEHDVFRLVVGNRKFEAFGRSKSGDLLTRYEIVQVNVLSMVFKLSGIRRAGGQLLDQGVNLLPLDGMFSHRHISKCLSI